MSEVASAFVSLVPSARGFGSSTERQIGPDLTRSGKKIGANFGRALFGAAAAIGAAVGVTKLFKDSLGEAREAQKVGALTNQVIKSTGGVAKVSAKHVGNLSTAISKKAGIDDEAIQSGANLLLTFKNVRNEAGKGSKVFDRATKAAVDLSAAGFGDINGASKQLGKALNDPIKGMTALGRSGVTFTKAQQDQIKALVTSGHALKAQKMILREVESQVGGAAAATATGGDKMRVAWGNLEEQLGTAFLPVIDKLAGFLTDKVIPAASKFIRQLQNGRGAGGALADVIGKVVSFVKNLAGVIGPPIGSLVDGFKNGTRAGGRLRDMFDNVVQIAESLGSLFADIATGAKDFATDFVNGAGAGGKLRDVLTKVADALSVVLDWLASHREVVQTFVGSLLVIVAAIKAWTIVQGILNAILLANPIGIIAVALAVLVTGLILAYKHSDTFRAIVDGAFRAVGAAIGFVKDHWKVFLTLFLAGFGPIGLALALLITHFNAVKSVVQTVFKFIVNTWFTVVGALVNGAAKAFGWVPGIGGKLKAAADKFNDFRDKVNAALDGIHPQKEIRLKVTTQQLVLNPSLGKPRVGGIEGAGATGAIVRRPTIALIGEAGPEALVPLNRTHGNSPLPGGDAQFHVENVYAQDVNDFLGQMQQRARRAGLDGVRP